MAKLVAVCVGLPQDIPWQGRTVRTGVWKQAVDGPRVVRRLNVDGDGQGDLAGHGGEQRAVLVYQLESYRYWEGVLGRDDLVAGSFGENFTVDGLADDEVCIGDRYRIGGAVFEVTQPRVTCYRVGIRLGEPRMASLLVAHRRPGFYLRVLEEGSVAAGDEITKVADGPGAMTVAEIDALLYLPGHPREGLERALAIPALSPGWQTSFRDLLAQDDLGAKTGNIGLAPSAAAPPPAWPGFRSMRVVRREAETPSVTSFWLSATDGVTLPVPRPGQFVTLRLRPDPDAPAVVRSYSLSNRPGEPTYRISVKREPHGTASGYVARYLQVGDAIEVAAPRGTFTLDGGGRPVVLLSAGIGVTPVLAMLHAIAESDPDREVWWLHGARSAAEHAFAREARALLAQLARARVHVCYSQPTPADPEPDAATSIGRLSPELLERLGVPHDADVYVCGPATFMAGFRASLTALGFDPRRIHEEAFGALAAVTPGVTTAPTGPPGPPPGPGGSGPAGSFARRGLTVAWDSSYPSLLELAEACRVPTRWSCRSGVCHTCETPLLAGSVVHAPEPIDVPAAGDVLLCCAQPRTEVTLDL